MGLERFDPEDHNPLQWDGQMVCRADGEYYRTADVDALLADIIHGLVDERYAADVTVAQCSHESKERLVAARAALTAVIRGAKSDRAALDAPLVGGGA